MELSYRLRFEGVDSAYHLWLNGEEIGYNQGSRNPAEFDISHVIRSGGRDVNTIRVKVYQWSDGSYIEDQDMWWLSGIFRDVYLVAFPRKAHIEDFFVKTILNEELDKATLEIDLAYYIQSSAHVMLKLTNAGEHVAEGWQTLDPERMTCTCTLDVTNPKLWDAEHPNLYHLSISLRTDKELAQRIDQQVGFRRVEIKKGLLHVNNVPISIRGVCRHDHHPRFGRAVPLEFIKHDLVLMKKHNVNALRTSHYPNDPRLVHMANELGLYVMDEADLECHGTGVDAGSVPSDKPSWKGAYLDRMKQLVHRDKNNPCVIMWSLGNESFYGQNHQAMYDWSKSFDETRPVHYEGGQGFRASDIHSYMYIGIADLAKLATQDGKDYQKPILQQEYAHAMGNGPGGLKEYMETYRKYRRLQGGYVWEWNNHGLVKRDVDDDSPKPFYAYGGDFGDEPNDYNFVMDGLCHSEHYPSPGLTELKAAYSPILIDRKGSKICAQNLYDFDNLSDVECIWSVRCYASNGKVQCLNQGRQGLSAQNAAKKDFDVMSCDKRQLCCDTSQPETWLKVSIRNTKALSWCDAGFEISHADFRLDNGGSSAQIPRSLKGLQNPRTDAGTGSLRVSTSTCSLDFDLIKGQIKAWRYKNNELLDTQSQSCSPQLTFWRGLTDNDDKGQAGDWKGHRLNALMHSVTAVSYKVDENSVFEMQVEEYIAPAIFAWGFDVVTTYKFFGDGALLIHIRGAPRGPSPSTLPRIGLEMELSHGYRNAEWFGLGPGATYKDMKQAGHLGVWKSNVDDMMYMYEMPQENGNRSETRWVKISDERGIGFRAVLERHPAGSGPSTSEGLQCEPSSPLENWTIVGDSLKEAAQPSGFDFALSRYTAKDLDQAQHPQELKGGRAQDGIVFRIDDDHHGLGSAACGPDVLDQYRLNTRAFNFTVSLEPIGL